jgi:hypothetical protein
MRFVLAGVLVAVALLAVGGASGGRAQTGTLVVTPSSGPVGTVVEISGMGCNNPGQSAYIVFEGGNGLSGTLGGTGIPNIPVDSNGQFSTKFTIPSTLDTLQGRGGGPVMPGQYAFSSKPPICQTKFTVTGAAGLPSTGGAPGSGSEWQTVVLAVVVGLAVAVGGALAARWAIRR